jgi:hypothetical protein
VTALQLEGNAGFLEVPDVRCTKRFLPSWMSASHALAAEAQNAVLTSEGYVNAKMPNP